VVALAALAVIRFGLQLEIGAQYDTNANRAETFNQPPPVAPGDTPPAAPVASFALAGGADAALAAVGERNAFKLRLQAGGKYFFAGGAAPQDVAVVHATLDDALKLGGGRFLLGLAADYYDAYQWNDCPNVVAGGQSIADTSCHRDFRTVGARPSLSVGIGPARAALGFGARLFQWKPDSAYSFAAPHLFAGVEARFSTGDEGENEWLLSATGRLEWRAYDAAATLPPGAPGPAPTRADTDLLATASIAYSGDFLGAASYALDWDGSNSFGESFLRHIVAFSVGMELPGQLLATVRAQLVFAKYPEGYLLLVTGNGAAQTIDDENRNALVFDLARAIGRVTLFARYSLFQNGVTNALVSYERQLMYVGARVRAW